MFPELERPPSKPGSDMEWALSDLGQAMQDQDASQVPRSPIAAGYTYLGQFIDHDLTLDLTPLDQVQPDAGRIRNFRTPLLDLDHVYGEGPDVSPFLYVRGSEHGAERFLVDWTRDNKGNPVSPNDLPRNSLGTALVGDPREDENLIVAQLHVAFLKFHNRVLDDQDMSSVLDSPPFGDTGSRFAAARRFVTWHYQWIVLNDFLQKILDPTVLLDSHRRRWGGANEECFQIPVEFNVAAFRFGHSLVRDRYRFRQREEFVDLIQLLELTGSGGSGMLALPEEWKIEWPFFFLFEGNQNPFLNRAEQIDTVLAAALQGLDPDTLKLFNARVRATRCGITFTSRPAKPAGANASPRSQDRPSHRTGCCEVPRRAGLGSGSNARRCARC